eukprot:3964223-Pleurochrysis_carterae.AAC.2
MPRSGGRSSPPRNPMCRCMNEGVSSSAVLSAPPRSGFGSGLHADGSMRTVAAASALEMTATRARTSSPLRSRTPWARPPVQTEGSFSCAPGCPISRKRVIRASCKGKRI